MRPPPRRQPSTAAGLRLRASRGRARSWGSRSTRKRPRRRACAACPAARSAATASAAASSRALSGASWDAGASTSVISPFGGSAKRAASCDCGSAYRLLEALRQLAADGQLALRQRLRRASADVAGSRRGDSNATAGQRQPRELLPEGVEFDGTTGQEAKEGEASAGEPARNQRGLDRGRPWKDAQRDALAKDGGDEQRSRIGDHGHPGVGDQGDPRARHEAAAGARRCGRPRCGHAARAVAPRFRDGRASLACDGCPRQARARLRPARRAHGASRRRGSRSGSHRPRAARPIRAPRRRATRHRSAPRTRRARRPRVRHARRRG